MSESVTYVIGVDGGGSGCRASLAQADGPVLATAEAGPANATSDFNLAVRNVNSAIASVCSDVGVTATRAHIGVAGILSERQAQRFADAVIIPGARVTDDRPTTLAGALAGRDGLLAAVGTGSFVGAYQGGGARFLGGWGLHLGDQASGAWLGRCLLQRMMLVNDGLAKGSPLCDAVFAQHDHDPNALVVFAAQAGPEDYATLAPQIVDAARNKDRVGTELMETGGLYLTSAFTALDPGGETAICLTGGVGPAFADWIDPAFAPRLTPPAGTAMDGALFLARQI